MMQYLEWYGRHPWLGTIILIVVGSVIVQCVQALFGFFGSFDDL